MKLTCEEISSFIDAYLDDEFDVRERAEFEAHVDGCESCRRRLDVQVEFRKHVKRSLSDERAPEHLRVNILEALHAEADAAPVRSTRRVGMMLAPLAAAAAAIVLLPMMTIAPAASDTPPAIIQAVDWHQRDFPMEIESSDPVAVSKWFEGKLDFPVRPPNFSASGKLLGARLANVEQGRAALVAYEVAGSKLSVLIFHGDAVEVPADRVTSIQERNVAFLNSNGYDVALLHDAGITYAITSSLEKAQLTGVMRKSMTP